MLLVLWALGWSTVVLALLVRSPTWFTTTVGLVMIAGHNLFDGVWMSNPVWSILHGPGFVWNTPEHVVFAVYPLIPWVGVMAAGFGLGQVYSWEAGRRRAFLLRLGLGLIAAFVVLRWLNVYGDPAPWSRQPTPSTPCCRSSTRPHRPSLLFLLMTLGPAMLFLRRLTACVRSHATRAGVRRVPLFYFGTALPADHLLAVLACPCAMARHTGCSSRQIWGTIHSRHLRDGDTHCRWSISSGCSS